ncbi:hypothetical protein IFT73_16940 [Aeromicrobium sp. CFBP 8757]|uniref:hypothetical protein n=1 Tax=Aeromicrobium sp. CFBP 8757 TaxID=2775288 RepID=UPI001785D890|nr:hypothetical protein [Aeromicrobium sp. CFBP 8757]MBD8608544.1 hypothetical protein [Aeromicrobium sp. CFBP 8757]
MTDKTVPAIELKHTTHGVSNTVFIATTVVGISSTRRYSFVIKALDGEGDPRGLIVTGNICWDVAKLVNPPAGIQGGNVLDGIAAGIAYRLTSRCDSVFALQGAGKASRGSTSTAMQA